MSNFTGDVTDAEFDTEVLAASHKLPVIVDFWAPWCQPCRVLKPILEKLTLEYGGRFRLVKINSDENPESAKRYSVRGIPAVKAFVGGKQVAEFSGALPESQVRAFIDGILPSPAADLIEAAMAARAEGDLVTAAALLDDARAADPSSLSALFESAEVLMASDQCQAARVQLDTSEALVRKTVDATRLAALRARLNLLEAGQGADVGALSALLDNNPEDLALRQQLANALSLAGRYPEAMEHFLAIVHRDRKWGDDAGRKDLLNLFNILAVQVEHDALVREYRIKLARTLN